MSVANESLQESASRVTNLSVIRDVAADAAAQTDPDNCLRRLRAGLRRLGFDRVGIFVLDRSNRATLHGTWGTDDEGNEVDAHDLCVATADFFGFEALEAGDRVVTRRVARPDDPGTPHEILKHVGAGRPNLAVVGLRADGRLIGVLAVDMVPSGGSLDPNRYAVLELLADLVAVAIARGQVASELRVANEELRQSEARDRAVSELASDYTYSVRIRADGSAENEWISDSVERITGYSPEVAADPGRLQSFAHPDDVPVLRLNDQKLLCGSATTIDYRVVTRQGEVKWLRLRSRPEWDEEHRRVVRIYAAAHDITELKLTEEADAQTRDQIEYLFDSLRAAFFCVDLVNPQRSRLSKNHLEIYGYEPQEFINDPPLYHKLIDPSDRKAVIALYHKNGDVPPHRYRITRRDGAVRWLESRVKVIFDGSGRPIRLYGLSEDITDRARLEDQLRESQKMEAVGQLAGGVAHDFNNLLTVIAGYGEMLLEALDQKGVNYEAVHQITVAAESAASLTRQLLAFSRRQIIAPKVFDLNSTVEHLSKMLRRLLGEDVLLGTTLRPNLGMIEADPGQIEQILMNIVTNARDAMPRGGKLTIETANVGVDQDFADTHEGLKPGPHVMLAISDTGVGITAATMTRIFEPFFTTKELGKGTGLGLAVVYGLVKQNQGSIHVYSEPDLGTTFRIYFPRVDSPLASAPTDVRPAVPRGSETILLVEDSANLRALARLSLQKLGYKVLEAEDGQRALRIAEQHPTGIDLLVSDVVMPGLSGREAAEKLKLLCPGIQVLLMSGYNDDVIVRHAVVDAGMAFLQKPFTPATLGCKVRQVLDGVE